MGMQSSIRVNDSDSALEAVVEGALSTTSSQDLGLDNSILSACAQLAPNHTLNCSGAYQFP